MEYMNKIHLKALVLLSLDHWIKMYSDYPSVRDSCIKTINQDLSIMNELKALGVID